VSTVREFLSSKQFRIASAIVLIALGLLCIAKTPWVADVTYYTAINDRAVELIDETLERDTLTFLVITGIKTSLAMIEGSNVGVGFELQVGDVVQPAYDYVDFFWRAFLYAFMVLGFYQLLLETEMLLLGLVLAGIGIVFLGIHLLVTIPQIDLRLWGRRCFLAGVLIAYVAPLSLIATDSLSDRYTSTLKEKHYATISAFDNQLQGSAVQFLALKNQISILQPSASIENMQNGMLRIVNSIGETFKLSLLAFLYYVLIILFELLFFPLLSAVVLYKFTLFALGRLVAPPAPQTPPSAPMAPAEAAS